MKGEIFAKAILVILSIAGIHLALVELAQYNIITTFLPQYSKWIYIGFGVTGAYMLYGLFSKK